jgi:hypothetical protein
VTVFLNLTAAERAEFRAHSREKVVGEFSKQRQMESLAQAYREVCFHSG